MISCRNFRGPVVAAAIASILICAGGGCSREAKTKHQIDLAQSHLRSKQWDRAEIYYSAALQIDPRSLIANRELAELLFDEGRSSRALPFLLRAKELAPDDISIRTKAGQAFLAMGESRKAQEEALYIIGREGLHTEAIQLLAEAATTSSEVTEARKRVDSLQKSAPQSASLWAAKGTLELKQRNATSAESSFSEAVRLDSQCAPARLGLGALHWGKQDLAAAEREFTAAAEAAQNKAATRLKLAQFEAQTGSGPKAKNALEEILRDFPYFLPAKILLAQLAIDSGKNEEAAALLARIFEQDPGNPEARLEKARLDIVKQQFESADAELTKLARERPKAAPIFYHLAVAALAQGQPEAAAKHLKRCLNISPSYTDAAVLLAGITIQRKDFSAAIPILRPIAAQRRDLAQPRMLLAGALLGLGQVDEALTLYKELKESFPKNAQVHWLIGLAQVQKGDETAAQQAFEDALALSADYLPAVEQLVLLHTKNKRYDLAHRQLGTALSRHPNYPRLYVLEARVFASEGNSSAAEASLKNAIHADPISSEAYFALAQHYIGARQTDEARARLEKIVEVKQDDAQALMLLGTIEDQSGNYLSASTYYERVRQLNPSFAACLNNLAYLYSERLNNTEKAFDIAQQARQLQSSDPNVTDTFAWILYKRRQYGWAFSLLKQSAAQLPNNLEAQSHFGLAAYVMGEKEIARTALAKAVQTTTSLPSLDQANAALAILHAIDSEPDETLIKTLEARVKRDPSDIIAYTQLGQLRFRAGHVSAARALFEKAQAINPDCVAPVLAKAWLCADQGDLPQAMELAKAARKTSPNNADVTWTLGRIAELSFDHKWAVSLLEESAASAPDDPERTYYLGRALYNAGREDEAAEMVGQAISMAGKFPSGAEARSFLETLKVERSFANETSDAPDFNANAADFPTLTAQASLSASRGDNVKAIAILESLLKKDPNFVPAIKRLARLYSTTGRQDRASYDLIVRAREYLPNDSGVLTSLAGFLYRKGEYKKVVPLLEGVGAPELLGPEGLYWLGMAKYRLKDSAGARPLLTAALAKNLPDPLAAEARQVLSEKNKVL